MVCIKWFILLIDGGGICGFIFLCILELLESWLVYCGVDVLLYNVFDFMVGMFSGGFIVVGLIVLCFGV